MSYRMLRIPRPLVAAGLAALGLPALGMAQVMEGRLAVQVFDLHRRVWLGIGARYGSGLPVELADDDDEGVGEGEASEYDAGQDQFIHPEILARVNFERARIRPNFSLDFSVGARLWEVDAQSVSIQFDVRNLTDRLNVINFNGLFSGTALAPGRLATVRLKMRF